MKTLFNLSMHRLSAVFWETVFEHCYERLPRTLDAIFANYERCEKFRSRADVNTGSISIASGICLYSLCLYFEVRRVVEIGTFIGKSTSSMALALSQQHPDGVIYTCDADNACFEAWDGLGCRMRSFPKQTSTQMLGELVKAPEAVDLFFFDGRIMPEDIPLVGRLTHPGTLFVFDDFEGTEKGVINVVNLRASLPRHVLIEPCPADVLQKYGVPGRSLSSLLFNIDNLAVSNQ